ncbi:MAG: c-type cytochrome [Myxococcales bacterium]|nr:c-type cytochrome [Myxococcales bacterium]
MMARTLLLIALLVAACSSKGDAPPAAAPPPVAPIAARPPTAGSMTAPVAVTPASEARKIFASRCAMCHGVGGRGDGAAALSMNPRPRDYTDATWQAAVTDADLTRTIVAGGAAVGLNSMMPAATDLQDKPAVVEELVKLIRGFSGTAAAPAAR